jgi:hypothetical protein
MGWTLLSRDVMPRDRAGSPDERPFVNGEPPGDTASAVLGAGTWAVGFCDCAFPSGITIDSVSHGYVQVTN